MPGTGFGSDFFDTVLDTARGPISDFFEANIRPNEPLPPIQQVPTESTPPPMFGLPEQSSYQPPMIFAPEQLSTPPMQFDLNDSGGQSMFGMNFDFDWGRDLFPQLQADINAGRQQAKAAASAKEGAQKSVAVSDNEVRQAARTAGVDPALFQRLVGQESGGDQGQVSPRGAFGAAQLMPDTAAYLAKKYNLDTSTRLGNLTAGAYYLKEQLDRFKDLRLALAAYNAGPEAVAQYGGVPPYGETQTYVQTVLNGYQGDGLKDTSLEGAIQALPSHIGTKGVGPTGSYEVGFGYGEQYPRPVMGDSGKPMTHHQGVDLVVSGAANSGRGTPVLAFASGRVTSVSRAAVAGNYVVVTDPDGRAHWYMHMDSTTPAIGQEIKRGEQVGILGGTGTEEWPHLHYEVRVNGQHLDPSPWLGR